MYAAGFAEAFDEFSLPHLKEFELEYWNSNRFNLESDLLLHCLRQLQMTC